MYVYGQRNSGCPNISTFDGKKTFLKKIFWLLLIYEGGEKTDDIGTKEIEKKITKIFTKKLLLWECKSQKENILFL